MFHASDQSGHIIFELIIAHRTQLQGEVGAEVGIKRQLLGNLGGFEQHRIFFVRHDQFVQFALQRGKAIVQQIAYVDGFEIQISDQAAHFKDWAGFNIAMVTEGFIPKCDIVLITLILKTRYPLFVQALVQILNGLRWELGPIFIMSGHFTFHLLELVEDFAKRIRFGQRLALLLKAFRGGGIQTLFEALGGNFWQR